MFLPSIHRRSFSSPQVESSFWTGKHWFTSCSCFVSNIVCTSSTKHVCIHRCSKQRISDEQSFNRCSSFVLSRLLHRTKRSTINSIMLECIPLYGSTCTQPTCQRRFKQRLMNQIQNVQQIDNVTVQVNSREFGNTSTDLTLMYLEYSSIRK